MLPRLPTPALATPRLAAPSRASATPSLGAVDGGAELITATFTLQPASWDARAGRAALDGVYGSSVMGRALVLPATGGGTSRYVWETHDDGTGRYVGFDPGDYLAALSGMTGIEVQHAAGNRTAAQRASAIRAALAGVGYTTGGSGATVTAASADMGTPAVAGMHDAAPTIRQHGTRRQTPQFASSPLNGVIAGRLVSPAASVVPYAIGVHLSAHAEQVRLACFAGGGDDLSTATTLLFEAITTGTSTGWNWVVLTPSQVAAIASSTGLWLAAKCNSATTTPGYTALGDTNGFDFAAQNMVILRDADTDSGELDEDPATTFASDPAGTDLSAVTLVSTAGVYPFLALLYRPAANTGTALQLRVGVHSDTALTSSTESDLTAPDAGGANVWTELAAPDVLGLEHASLRLAVGSTHSSQFRGAVYHGGASEDPDTATLAYDGGQTSGSTTNAWQTLAAPAGVAVPAGQRMWAVFRGTGGITIRYASNANGQAEVGPDWNPCDLPVSGGVGDGAEYETNTGNPNHATSSATAFEDPMVADASDFLPGNYPGVAITLTVPADEAA